jgi:exodeoxyribonuclease-3
MKIATWNVNSIRARLDRLLPWLGEVRPDVVCLQEIKVTEEGFPYEPLREAGYRAAVYGQKTYNGVAILSRAEPVEVRHGMDDEVDDPQARLISARVGIVWIVNAYVPNGQSVGSPKYAYKLAWLRRLQEYFWRHFDPSDRLALCGDFNVAPDDLDVAQPETWAGTVLCHGDARGALEGVRAWGLTDIVRRYHPQGGIYTWWDYRGRAFARDDGLRIDHVFTTAAMDDRCIAAEIDRRQRGGEKPSDHVPVVAIFGD